MNQMNQMNQTDTRTTAPEQGSDEITALLFSHAEKTFALDVAACRDANKGVHLTHVPHSPAHVAGIVNIRGEIVTVFHLSELLGYAGHAGEGDIIIRLKSGSESVALLADRLLDTVTLKNEVLEDASFQLNETEQRVISHVSLLETRTILLIAVPRLLEFLNEQ